MRKGIVALAIVLTIVIVAMSGTAVLAAEKEYKEVVVPTEWIPIDPVTHEVLTDLGVRQTDPSAYDRSEVAEFKNGEYYITYMGTPAPQSPGSWSASNFMYTGNVMYRDKFYRVVANGMSFNNPNFSYLNSAVLRLEYGDFTDESFTEGLHGISETPYQEGVTLKLYLATVESNLSEATFVEDVLNISRPVTTTAFLEALLANIQELTYFDNGFTDYGKVFLTVTNPSSDVFEKILVYHYDSEAGTSGNYLQESGGNLNLLAQDDEWISALEPGRYEIVFPFYIEENIHEFLSSPSTFSRNRYTLSDSIHFTLVLEERDGQDVTVRYEDLSGHQVAEPDVYAGKLGEAWSSEAKKISGWTLSKVLGTPSGVFTDEPQEVVYQYAKTVVVDPVIPADVTVKYVDEDGKDLREPVILKGEIGAPWKAEEKDIDGWVLVTTPDNLTGTFTSESQIVIFVYKEEVVLGDEDTKETTTTTSPTEVVKGDEDEKEVDVVPTGESYLSTAVAILFVLAGTVVLVPTLKKRIVKK